MPVTIAEIAKEANVSKTIVSRVMNNKPGVGDKTREKVQKIIEQKNYRVNRLAQSLSTQKTGVIGVILTNLCSVHLFKMIEGIEQISSENSYHVMFCNGNKDAKTKNQYIDFFYSGHADGVLIYGSSMNDDKLIKDLYKTNYPFVLIENNISDIDANTILIDNFGGSVKAVNNAISLGHTKIAYIQGAMINRAAADRYQGYAEGMKNHNIELNEDYIIQSKSFSFKEGYQAAEKLLQLQDRPTCIMCGSDSQAYGTIECCMNNGLSIPNDISIIGFDYDRSYADNANYPELTTVRQPMDVIGTESAKLLIDKIVNNTSTNKKIIIPTAWVKGATLRKVDYK